MQAVKYRLLRGDKAPRVKGGGVVPSGRVTDVHAGPRRGRMPQSKSDCQCVKARSRREGAVGCEGGGMSDMADARVRE